MSKTDITGEKLVYSVDKDKAAASDKADSSARDASDGEKKKPLSQDDNKYTGSRPSSAGAKSRGGGDPYQGGRRVWPD
ncbi:MAG TPA: hypothetical protein VFL97_05510 [Nitrococcus sp.]|nr:hypothetical protein [Nitrococcus sp.]